MVSYVCCINLSLSHTQTNDRGYKQNKCKRLGEGPYRKHKGGRQHSLYELGPYALVKDTNALLRHHALLSHQQITKIPHKHSPNYPPLSTPNTDNIHARTRTRTRTRPSMKPLYEYLPLCTRTFSVNIGYVNTVATAAEKKDKAPPHPVHQRLEENEHTTQSLSPQ
jgi:hypothetical protein